MSQETGTQGIAIIWAMDANAKPNPHAATNSTPGGMCERSLNLSSILARDQRSDHQRDDGHELDQDVHRRTGGVLERIAHGIAYHGCLVSV